MALAEKVLGMVQFDSKKWNWILVNNAPFTIIGIVEGSLDSSANGPVTAVVVMAKFSDDFILNSTYSCAPTLKFFTLVIELPALQLAAWEGAFINVAAMAKVDMARIFMGLILGAGFVRA